MLMAVAPAAAQQAIDWDRMTAWQDSLETVTDVVALRTLRATASEPGGREGQIRMSLLRLRQAVVRLDRSDLALAMENLLQDAHHQPNSGRIQYELARAMLQFDAVDLLPLNGGGMLEGEAYLEAAWRFLREGMRREPSLAPLRALVLITLVDAGDREIRADALAALAPFFNDSEPPADAWLIWARHQRRVGSPDSVLVALDRAAAGGGDPSVLSLERAWALMARGDTVAAAQAYWQGLDRLTSAGRALYRYDLAWIISDDSLAVFDAVPDADVVPWTRRFWAGRDVDAANVFGGRLREHLRRRVHVLTHYRQPVPWRRTHFERVEYGFDGIVDCVPRPPEGMYDRLGVQPALPGDTRHRELLLDHRGVVYLRHGEPARVVQWALPGKDDIRLARNESWVYFMAGRQRLLHFHASTAVGSFGPTTLRSHLVVHDDLYYSRGLVDPIYALAADALRDGSSTCNVHVRAAIEAGMEDATLSLATDSDTGPITKRWNSILSAYRVGSVADGSSRLLVTLAAAVKDMTVVQTADGRVEVPIRMRITGYDARSDRYVQGDTLIVGQADRLNRNQWLGLAFAVPLPAGQWTFSVQTTQEAVKQETGGMSARLGDIDVPAAGRLWLTDPVAGRAGGVPWRAPDGVPFPLNPAMVWTPSQDLELYYEVQGLPEGTAFQTSIQVLRSGATRPQIEVRSTAESTGPRLVMRRTLDLRALQSGAWQVRIRITSGGSTIERGLSFQVNR